MVETPEPAPHVLAEINGEPITEETYRYWWDKKPPARDDVSARSGVLKRLIERSVIAHRAEEAGLMDDPIVAESIQSMLISRLKELELMPQLEKIKVTEKEAREYYETVAADQFTEPERLKVAVLWFDTRGRSEYEEKYRPKLAEIRSQLADGREKIDVNAGFGQLAIKTSEHQASRYKGGDIGWLEVGAKYDSWRSAVLDIAKRLKTMGELSPVESNEQGIFLVRLIEHRDQRVRSFNAVKSQILRELKAERSKQIEESFMADLYQGLDIKRYPENLKQIKGLKTGENDYRRSVAGPVIPKDRER